MPVDPSRRATVQGVANLRSSLDPSEVHLSLTCDDGQVFNTPLQATSNPTILRYVVELPLPEAGHTCVVKGYVGNASRPFAFNPVTYVNNSEETEIWISGIDDVVLSRTGGL